MPHRQPHHHAAQLRSLLTSLLLLTPPQLTPTQISPDLHMRQRMLSLPPQPPHAYDLPETDSFSTSSLSAASDDDRTASQHDFVSWLSRPPVELAISTIDVEATAHGLFTRRLTALRVAEQGEMDPIDLCDYEVLCCDAWHDHRRLLVRFPTSEGGEDGLYMMVTVGEEGDMRLDNLFATERTVVHEKGLHRCTIACTPSMTSNAAMEEEQDEDQGAEYINDADDFWAGFSDDEDAEAKKNVETTGSFAVDTRSMHEQGTTDQETAIRDIIRGAYTLHRSIRSPSTDSVEDFIRLVKTSIATS
ncbi:hypothetical protein EX895_002101 [Sporisorium graminicola]|uniref:Uncharacterized protein n=1 Tax=Sporisorium graminicola TaxID=280036 RepID=A0A4U7KWK0_9BASI|nr:hypothetical protein EX895_002101 [Sporisorium graminicola]TKY88860.1 hypothetical protein EX895_002101 [Sporisorium graminicola]